MRSLIRLVLRYPNLFINLVAFLVTRIAERIYRYYLQKRSRKGLTRPKESNLDDRPS